MAATALVVSSSVHDEMSGYFPQDACGEESSTKTKK